MADATVPPAQKTAAAPKPKRKRVNVRRKEVMERVGKQVQEHYKSPLVEKLRERGGSLTVGDTTVHLARQFGFCYGVERAIDLAYAARKVFPEKQLHLIGEIIHNPEVNRQLADMGIHTLGWQEVGEDYEHLGEEDVVIVPAFGTTTPIMQDLEARGCIVVDTTCGDVMSVWKRVRKNAEEGFTSIIHGKAGHEETRATASRALGSEGTGHYLVVLTLNDVEIVTDYIRNGGDSAAFLERFSGCTSEGFDPDIHLARVGVANQTTMLKSETEEIQRRIEAAVKERDGNTEAAANFRFADTICGATQERQDALFTLLGKKMDMLIVVGGYNSSNTSHLVEIGEKQLPSFFIRNSDCLKSLEEIIHFDLHREEEKTSYTEILKVGGGVTIGITAGASCPNNLIEETLLKLFALRNHSIESVLGA